jgi:hypothetical protein
VLTGIDADFDGDFVAVAVLDIDDDDDGVIDGLTVVDNAVASASLFVDVFITVRLLFRLPLGVAGVVDVAAVVAAATETLVAVAVLSMLPFLLLPILLLRLLPPLPVVPTGIELDFLSLGETVAVAAPLDLVVVVVVVVVAGTYLAGFPIDAAKRLGSLAASSSVTGRGFHTFLGLPDDDDGVYVSDIIVM